MARNPINLSNEIEMHEINISNENIANTNVTEEPTPRMSESRKVYRQPIDKTIITDDTTCGIWKIRGDFLQKFANRNVYVLFYGLLGCLCSATYAYFNGIITTLEKRFGIPSKTTGIISVGNDVSQLFVSMVLSYYAGRRHRPRWMALGLYTVVAFCFLSALPHLLYGPGEDALLLTAEFGETVGEEYAQEAFRLEQRKTLCHNATQGALQCEAEGANYAPQVIFFVAQFISGMGAPLYYTLGVSYMDDNIKKSKTPALVSFSFSLRMMGHPLGYGLASLCLKYYISPSLTPTISIDDPRWLGAWWIGWLLLALLVFVFGSLLALFPKTLPSTAARKIMHIYTLQRTMDLDEIQQVEEPETPASFKDMISTFWRLCSNKTLMFNNSAAIFYFLGFVPYWVFLPKYIEMQYRQTASTSSLITGTVGLLFSAIGVLISGFIISKYKPRARYLAAWNVIVGAISVLGIISYAFLGCSQIDNKLPIMPNGELNPSTPCNLNCDCDYVKYNPVCSSDGKTTFISACHAGCRTEVIRNNSRYFADCACITPFNLENGSVPTKSAQTATPGNCPLDCIDKFYIFLAVVCFLKFLGATGRASNFLVTVRCVHERDKPVAIGFGLTMMSLCAFVPAPIIFGVLMDKACLVWGKTCTGNGNCWLYNVETLRYTMNLTAAVFVTIGTLFDGAVWYVVKGLKIFDDEDKEEGDNRD